MAADSASSMTCAEARALLPAFFHGELSPGRMRRLQLHLGGCAACRAAGVEARRVHDVVIPVYLSAYAHGQLVDSELEAVEAHLAYCTFCRDDFEGLREASNELTRNLSPYQITRNFRLQVMQDWKPHRAGRLVRHKQRSLADLIERAEAGNSFTYERLVDRYKDYAYLAAFRRTRDFQWARAVARTLFVQGFPVFEPDLFKTQFLAWLDNRAKRLVEKGGWQDESESLEEMAEGLSGYKGSHKLRRHRLILSLDQELEEGLAVPFLLFYVQRLDYAGIAELLDRTWLDIFDALDQATRAAHATLVADAKAHPRLKPAWER